MMKHIAPEPLRARLHEVGDSLRWIVSPVLGTLSFRPWAERSALKGPLMVQIQTVDTCNTTCPACPQSRREGRPPNFMDPDLYDKIIRELEQLGTARVICPTLHNESFLDPQILPRVRAAKDALRPGARLEIVTNGTLLTPAIIQQLCDCRVDMVAVSLDAFREETFRTVRPGVDFHRAVRNVHNLITVMGADHVAVRFLKQRANHLEEREFSDYWHARGVRVVVTTPANRAGALPRHDRLLAPSSPTTRRLYSELRRRIRPSIPPVCTLPFWQLNVRWDGGVLLCCHDWNQRDKIGDLRKQSIEQIWHSAKFNHYRRLLWKGNISESQVCRSCSCVASAIKV